MDINSITEKVIGGAIQVHRELGPGLLEAAYEACLSVELAGRGLSIERQCAVPLLYRGTPVECGFRMDMLVERRVVVELKCVTRFDQVHTAQMITYLKLSHCCVGLLINFNVLVLKDGIRRIVLNFPEPPPRPQRPPR